MPVDQPPQGLPLSAWQIELPKYQFMTFYYHGDMASVSKDGRVAINWKRVEDAAADPTDGMLMLYAKLLIAARDGTADKLPDDD